MKSILDPRFRYISSVDTDLRKTFARIRREQRQQTRTDTATSVSSQHNVQVMTPRKRAAA
jgi:hypothetical protein